MDFCRVGVGVGKYIWIWFGQVVKDLGAKKNDDAVHQTPDSGPESTTTCGAKLPHKSRDYDNPLWREEPDDGSGTKEEMRADRERRRELVFARWCRVGKCSAVSYNVWLDG